MSENKYQTCPNSYAVVNGGSIQTFGKNLTADDREVFQVSQSYAQTYGAYQWGIAESVDWFKIYYMHILKGLGWELCGITGESDGITFDRYVCKGKELRLDKTIMELITDKKLGASEQEIDYVRMSMSSLEDFADSADQMSIWDSHARNKHESGKLGNFQILPCEKDSEGTLTMVIVGVIYTAQKSKGRFLWYNWKKGDITVQQAAARLQLKRYDNPGPHTSRAQGRDWYEATLPRTLDNLAWKGADLIRNLPLG